MHDPEWWCIQSKANFSLAQFPLTRKLAGNFSGSELPQLDSLAQEFGPRTLSENLALELSGKPNREKRSRNRGHSTLRG